MEKKTGSELVKKKKTNTAEKIYNQNTHLYCLFIKYQNKANKQQYWCNHFLMLHV